MLLHLRMKSLIFRFIESVESIEIPKKNTIHETFQILAIHWKNVWKHLKDFSWSLLTKGSLMWDIISKKLLLKYNIEPLHTKNGSDRSSINLISSIHIIYSYSYIFNVL